MVFQERLGAREGQHEKGKPPSNRRRIIAAQEAQNLFQANRQRQYNDEPTKGQGASQPELMLATAVQRPNQRTLASASAATSILGIKICSSRRTRNEVPLR
jgi:hypothetical protein